VETDVADDLVIKTAWRRSDVQLEADAKAYWDDHKLVPSDQQFDRAMELVAIGYRNGSVVAVSTAELVILPGLRARFAMGRVSVAPEERRGSLGARLGGYMRRTIEAWSLEHPEEDVKGFGGVITAAEFGEKQSQPVWNDWGVDIAVAGYMPGGEQIRIGWFAHARL
jgi:hypothetical protein